MKDKDYPVFPPEGIFYFPDVMCLIKKGVGDAEITRVDKNEFKINEKFSVCRMKEGREMTISETECRVKAGDMVRIGDAVYEAETNVITVSPCEYEGCAWDNAYTVKDLGLSREKNTYTILPTLHFLPGVYFLLTNECLKMRCVIDTGACISTQKEEKPVIAENKLIDALVLNALELNIIKAGIKEIKAETDKISDIRAKTDELSFLDGDVQARINKRGVLRNPPSEEIEDYKADITNLDAAISSRAVEANAQAHVLAALNEFDPPKRSEATADKEEIIAAFSTDQQDFNVSGD